jgi:hypothetical protein
MRVMPHAWLSKCVWLTDWAGLLKGACLEPSSRFKLALLRLVFGHWSALQQKDHCLFHTLRAPAASSDIGPSSNRVLTRAAGNQRRPFMNPCDSYLHVQIGTPSTREPGAQMKQNLRHHSIAVHDSPLTCREIESRK